MRSSVPVIIRLASYSSFIIPRSSFDFDEALAHVDALPADVDAADLFALRFDPDFDKARAAHLDPLLADDLRRAVVAAADEAVAHEVGAERPARGARRRVFGDAERRGEHAAVDGGAGVLDLAREDQ